MDVIARNNLTVRGQGSRTFMFAHGFGCDQNMWRHVAPAFAAEGTVVLFDHVGAGASDLAAYSPEKYATLEGYATDVIEICEALRLGPMTFVGHSVSATIGVLAAARRPELFEALVLVCPSPRYADAEGYRGGFAKADIDDLLELMSKNALNWSALMAPVVAGAAHVPAQDEWRDSVCRIDPDIARDFARATFLSDHRADYARVTTPTLLIECEEDALAPPQVGAFVNAAIVGSDRRILPSSGHCPHMTSPAAVVSAIRSFIPGAQRRAA